MSGVGVSRLHAGAPGPSPGTVSRTGRALARLGRRRRRPGSRPRRSAPNNGANVGASRWSVS